jgi:hypothetical protein
VSNGVGFGVQASTCVLLLQQMLLLLLLLLLPLLHVQ